MYYLTRTNRLFIWFSQTLTCLSKLLLLHFLEVLAGHGKPTTISKHSYGVSLVALRVQHHRHRVQLALVEQSCLPAPRYRSPWAWLEVGVF